MRKLVVILALALMAGACSDKNEDADQNKNKVLCIRRHGLYRI